MCGIYGSTIPYSQNEVESKLERTSFRGPDRSKYQFFKSENQQVIFGHNRLSIIDLDERSDQPFTYLDKIHIVFNGEVFNFLEIRKELEAKNYSFRTTSDTEVICAAYCEYGESCVEHFNGMFAFVIYDERKSQLFGARDRLGQKPFFYYWNKTDFEFSSQPSSIKLCNKRLSVSENSIESYLMWGYVPDPHSIYNEVKKLLPGHSFTFDLRKGLFEEKQYWDIDFKGSNIFQGSYDEAKNQLESLLQDAVKKRLVADVPLGIFLSGGVDSSLIASLAQKQSADRVKTFSIKFLSKGFDESQYAEKVANHLATDHTTIECTFDEGLDLIKNITHYYDEPFSDSSAVPSMLLSKYTRKHVTVALSGDAGDELFLGYHRYNWIKIAENFYRFPKFIQTPSLKVLRAVPYYRSKVVADVLSAPDSTAAYLKMNFVSHDWIQKTQKDYIGHYHKYLFHNTKNIYERVSDFDIKTYLNGDINTKVDRASMAFSLEARSPLMDYRVVEFSRTLPTEFKFKGKVQKRILKDILYQHVPSSYFDRPKSGFTMPFKEWFRNELKEFVLDELSEAELKKIPKINADKVQELIRQHMDGSWNRYPQIWRLLVLKQWMNNNSN